MGTRIGHTKPQSCGGLPVDIEVDTGLVKSIIDFHIVCSFHWNIHHSQLKNFYK